MKPNLFFDPWEEVIATLQKTAREINLLHKLIRFSEMPKYSNETLIRDLIFSRDALPDGFDLFGDANKLISYAEDILLFYTDPGNDYVDMADFEKQRFDAINNEKFALAGKFIKWYCLPTQKLKDEEYQLFRDRFIQSENDFSALASNVLRLLKYDEFLKTPYWRSISRYVREERGECELCGSKERLHVHHKTYDHHGFEHQHLDDLQCLCHDCHLKVHHELNKKK